MALKKQNLVGCVVFSSVITILFSCCKERSESNINSNAPVAQSNAEFEMTSKERDQLLTAAQSVRIGMSHEDIIKLLGKPDKEDVHTGKQHSVPRRLEMWYFTRIWKRGLSNPSKDQGVNITLDVSNRVTRIRGLNVVIKNDAAEVYSNH